jgi:MFS family permease
LSKKERLSESKIRRNLLFAFILIFFTLSWWSISISIYKKFYQPMETLNSSITLIARASYYISIVVSSIIGSIITKKIKKSSFLSYWMLMGAVSSIIPIFLISTNEWHLFTVSFLLGSVFGIGLPSCLALFAEMTNVDNRGRLSGVVFLASNLVIAIIAVALLNVELALVALVAGVWRVIGLMLFFVLKPEEERKVEADRHFTSSSVFQNRQFIFYFVPWVAFSLIEWVENPIRANLFGEFATFAEVLGVAIGSIGAAVGGIFADKIGRKIIVLYGFISIGIAYAVLSIAPANILVWYFFTLIDAIAFGLIYVIFILTLWGDLSQHSQREKYYAIGTIPFFIAGILELVVRPYVSLIHPESAFSLAAFFLFLAVLPLLYAQETLPEKTIRDRELREYVEKAKRKALGK